MGEAMKRNIKYIIISVIVIIIFFLMVHSLADFQRARKVLINDSEKAIMKFNNNKIETTAVLYSQWILNYHSSAFFVYIKYYLEDEIKIHKDAINIKYEGKPIKWNYIKDINSNRKKRASRHANLDSFIKWESAERVKDPNHRLSGKGHLFLPFSISDDIEVKEGDEIKITAPDFITYNGDTLSLEEMTIEIGKFFR